MSFLLFHTKVMKDWSGVIARLKGVPIAGTIYKELD